MKQTQQEKHFLNLAGEYGVCSELAKRGITANLTFGNHKAADVIFVNIKTKRAYTIEVKTTSNNRIVTSFFQKYYNQNTLHPDFWVIVTIDKSQKSIFYVLTHQEMGEAQMKRNGMNSWKMIEGVDNVLVRHIEQFEGKWETIILAQGVN